MSPAEVLKAQRFQLTLTDDEARLLVRAATAGLKGSRSVVQDPATAHTLFNKLTRLAAEIVEQGQ